MTPLEKAIQQAERSQYGGRKRKKPTDGENDSEAAFDTMLDACAPDLPKPAGYRNLDEQFSPIAGRGWKVDRYFGNQFAPGVVVECEGIGHNKINWSARNSKVMDSKGYDKDIDKYNAISAAGYTLLRVTTFKLDIEPDDFFRTLRQALKNKGIIV